MTDGESVRQRAREFLSSRSEIGWSEDKAVAFAESESSLARRAIKLIIGRDTNTPWSDVPDSEVEAYICAAVAIHDRAAGPGRRQRVQADLQMVGLDGCG